LNIEGLDALVEGQGGGEADFAHKFW